MASFAVAMKALKDNPRMINTEIKPNIVAIDETNALNKEDLVQRLLSPEKVKEREALMALLDNFEDGKTYGSLIKIAPTVSEKLPLLKTLVNEALLSGHIFASRAAEEVLTFIKMAEILATKYDCVVANPPYMGNKGQNAKIKKYAEVKYENSKNDLYSMFIERIYDLTKYNAYISMITLQSWMFLSSYRELRKKLLSNSILTSMVHLGAGAFEEINAFNTLSTMFSLKKSLLTGYKTTYKKLTAVYNSVGKKNIFNEIKYQYISDQDRIFKIPNFSILYWLSDTYINIFDKSILLDEIATSRAGITTSDNDLFTKKWFEVSIDKCKFDAKNEQEAHASQKLYFPYHKSGNYRKWYGNNETLIKYDKENTDILSSIGNHLPSRKYYFLEGITYCLFGFDYIGVRYKIPGALFDVGSSSIFIEHDKINDILAFMLSKVAFNFLSAFNPTVNFQVGDIKNLPYINPHNPKISINALRNIEYAKIDWDSFETSWDFERLPMLSDTFKKETLAKSYQAWRAQNAADIAETLALEEENNRLFIDAYGLQDEITPEVPIEQITLTVNPRYRYKNTEASDEELEARFKADSMKELISYAIGCYMGRYSLDQAGLVYANEKNVGFDATQYQIIPADGDGIIPLTDTCWFPEEDMVNRLVDFVKTVWGQETLAENLDFIASGLDRKSTETAVEAIRRYLTKDFYKNHLQMYKNRPIYWLFSSGKEKAFECLVYMHRMNEQTLAHIRMQFVVPLISKMNGALENMDKDIAAADSSAKQRQLNKEKEKLVKQYAELNKFDDALNHAINERITIDLDDGVKVNYAKFAPLVAESKKVVGK